MNAAGTRCYKLCFYVPADHLEAVKDAVFAAGAGRIGDYAQCAWQVRGVGQFCPLPGSNAFIGEVGKTEQVAEFKVEMVCAAACIQDAVAALLDAHPYETPAYEYWAVQTAPPAP